LPKIAKALTGKHISTLRENSEIQKFLKHFIGDLCKSQQNSPTCGKPVNMILCFTDGADYAHDSDSRAPSRPARACVRKLLLKMLKTHLEVTRIICVEFSTNKS
jgi:hypothetical protein